MGKRILVIGGGAREHAIVLKLLNSSQIERIFAAPGNPGILLSDTNRVELLDIGAGDVDSIVDWCSKNCPNMVVVGPEDPLNKGLVDRLESLKLSTLSSSASPSSPAYSNLLKEMIVFGPTKMAAQIECDKAYSKEFMKRYNIPTAKYEVFNESSKAVAFIEQDGSFSGGRYVIKASGLAAGKGVLICQNKGQAIEAVESVLDKRIFGDAGKTIIIEEFLEGEECSVLAFSDGNSVAVMPAAQDHKRAFDSDLGPNTGGMGAICPFDLVESNERLRKEIEDTVMQRCISGLSSDGRSFVGVLFAGLMITKTNETGHMEKEEKSGDRIKVLEFNCRFGDPEAQSVLPLLKSDLYDIFEACYKRNLDIAGQIEWKQDVHLCGIVLADADYPETVTKGQLIQALPVPTSAYEYANPIDGQFYVIHAGTKFATASLLDPDQDNDDNKKKQPALAPIGKNKNDIINSVVVTNGGRILTVVGCSSVNIMEARSIALRVIECIKTERSRYRRDIGQRSIDRQLAGEHHHQHHQHPHYHQHHGHGRGEGKGEGEGRGRACGTGDAGEGTKSGGGLTYKDCGVDIEKGNEFVYQIKELVKSTNRDGVMSQIGSFGAFFDLAKTNLKDPILISGTDGVGTKLKLALDYDSLDSVGIDLVAMCVNDILVHGAEPLFFLDYYACGKLNLRTAKRVLEGIVDGCKLAGCALIGGETAEMSGLYQGNDIDLAGFAVGAVERSKVLPRMEQIKAGDVIIGLASSGVHSNGFSLVRKLLELRQKQKQQQHHHHHLHSWSHHHHHHHSHHHHTNSAGGHGAERRHERAHRDHSDDENIDPDTITDGEETVALSSMPSASLFLEPTHIYVKQMMPAIQSGMIKAMAHITGGGLLENIPRSLPESLCAKLDANKWDVLPVFAWIQKEANIELDEMLRTFNCGLGMVCIVDPANVDAVLELLRQSTDVGSTTEKKLAKVYQVGHLVEASKCGGKKCCQVDNVKEAFELATEQLGAWLKSGPDLDIDSSGFTAPHRHHHPHDHHDHRHDHHHDHHHHHHEKGLHMHGHGRGHGHGHEHGPARSVHQTGEPSSDDCLAKSPTDSVPHHRQHQHFRLRGGPNRHRGPGHHDHRDHDHHMVDKVSPTLHSGHGQHHHHRPSHHGRHHHHPHPHQHQHQHPHHHDHHHHHRNDYGHGHGHGHSSDSDTRQSGENNGKKETRSCGLLKARQTMSKGGIVSGGEEFKPKQVAILLSGTGTNARAIIERQQIRGTDWCGYQVVLAISNKSDAKGLEFIGRIDGIETRVISHKDFQDRVSFDMEMDKVLRSHDIDIICLAGFMRILSKEFVEKWSGKLINIHPSLLPSFKGMNGYKQALDSGVRITGCTVHYVNAGVDEGAIIYQDCLDIYPGDTEESLSERGKQLENRAFPKALSKVARGEVTYDIERNRSLFH